MNEQFTVVRNFQDKYTNQSYTIGQTYNAEDQDRARELESGGYIAPSNTLAAKDAQAQSEMSQAEAQKLAQAHSQAASNAEPKTVVNGKVVPLKFAQAAEAGFNAAEESSQTGIRQHHDNATEAVQAGQIAKNQTGAEAGAAQMYNQQQTGQTVKKGNVQSAQAHLEQHLQQAQQEAQTVEQQIMQNNQQKLQQSEQAKAKAAAQAGMKNNPMAAAHEEAADTANAAEEVKSKAARAATKKQGQ